MLIAALGSSFAAGPTLEPVADRAAMRSAVNYPHRLAAALGADLVDLTVSGATCASVLEVPQVIAPGVRFPPQIDGLPAGADLVTLTVGGNDLRYVGSMVATAWRRHDPTSRMSALLGAQNPAIADPTAASVDAVAADLVRIVEAVRFRAPRARVVLVDYLTVLGAAGRSSVVDYAPAELSAFRLLQDALERAFRSAAGRTGARLVAASAHSRDHGLGSAEPWINDFIPDVRRAGGSFHPNEAGMGAVAELLVTAVG